MKHTIHVIYVGITLTETEQRVALSRATLTNLHFDVTEFQYNFE